MDEKEAIAAELATIFARADTSGIVFFLYVTLVPYRLVWDAGIVCFFFDLWVLSSASSVQDAPLGSLKEFLTRQACF